MDRSAEPVKMLSLAEVALAAPLSVQRDASFATLGFISAPLPGMLAFAEEEKLVRIAAQTEFIAAVITRPQLAGFVPESLGLALADDPRQAFSLLHNYLALKTDFYGADNCLPSKIGEAVTVHPRASIAELGVTVGSGCNISANATVLAGSTLCDAVSLHEGVVVGATGLQVERFGDAVVDLEHAGRVVIEEGARIMANCVIARGLFRQKTTIGRDVRIGNLCFVSHNVSIGRGSIIGHGVTINGGVHIGRNVTIGPGATIANGVTIDDGAEVMLGSVVVRNVPAGARVSGNFAMDHRAFLRLQRGRR